MLNPRKTTSPGGFFVYGQETTAANLKSQYVRHDHVEVLSVTAVSFGSLLLLNIDFTMMKNKADT
ncbi:MULTISPECIES: hypothetical protein, partial [Enterobacteriaceae]|uniref:hypothetical protein n=1 Tax=Enterobacteriaceae TaxID=543 RepID=UPI00195EF159